MSESSFDVARQRLRLAVDGLDGLLDLLNAVVPGARIDPSGVRALLAPAVAEVREAEQELLLLG